MMLRFFVVNKASYKFKFKFSNLLVMAISICGHKITYSRYLTVLLTPSSRLLQLTVISGLVASLVASPVSFASVWACKKTNLPLPLYWMQSVMVYRKLHAPRVPNRLCCERVCLLKNTLPGVLFSRNVGSLNLIFSLFRCVTLIGCDYETTNCSCRIKDVACRLW